MPGESERYKPYRVDEESNLKAAREKAAEYGVEEGCYTTGRVGDGIIRRSVSAEEKLKMFKNPHAVYRSQIRKSSDLNQINPSTEHEPPLSAAASGRIFSVRSKTEMNLVSSSAQSVFIPNTLPGANAFTAKEGVFIPTPRSKANAFMAKDGVFIPNTLPEAKAFTAKDGVFISNTLPETNAFMVKDGVFIPNTQPAAADVTEETTFVPRMPKEAAVPSPQRIRPGKNAVPSKTKKHYRKTLRKHSRARQITRYAAGEMMRSAGNGEMSAEVVSNTLLRAPAVAAASGRGLAGAIRLSGKAVRGTLKGAKHVVAGTNFLAGAPKKIYTFIRSPAARAKQVEVARQAMRSFARRGKERLVKAGLHMLPLILAGVLLLAPVVVIIGQLPFFSLKSTDEELNKIYLYVTQLDAELTRQIQMIQKSAAFQSVSSENVHFYINGHTASSDFQLKTDADYILKYLDAKYGDYAFDKPIYGLFGGTNVKSELEAIHQSLYSYSTNLWTEEVIEEPPPFGEEDYIGPLLIQAPEPPKVEKITHLDINVWVSSFEQNAKNLLADSELEAISMLDMVGVYTLKHELRNPFENKPNWFISRRWGMWCNGGRVEKNNGINIRQRSGAPVCCVKTGVVTVAGSEGQSGYTVRITCGKTEVVYSNLSSDLSVKAGETVTVGSRIGNVGDGGYLHLEYWKNGESVNPLFYIDGYYRSAGTAGPGGEFTQAQQDIVTKALEVYENPWILGDPRGGEGAYVGCAAFCASVYWAAGHEDSGRDAINYWSDWRESGGESRSVIPVGALVVSAAGGPDGSVYGHVGIYIGGGEVIHYSGRVWKHSLEKFLAFCGGDRAVTVNQGQVYIGYQGWVWPNGIVLGTYSDETGC